MLLLPFHIIIVRCILSLCVCVLASDVYEREIEGEARVGEGESGRKNRQTDKQRLRERNCQTDRHRERESEWVREREGRGCNYTYCRFTQCVQPARTTSPIASAARATDLNCRWRNGPQHVTTVKPTERCWWCWNRWWRRSSSRTLSLPTNVSFATGKSLYNTFNDLHIFICGITVLCWCLERIVVCMSVSVFFCRVLCQLCDDVEKVSTMLWSFRHNVNKTCTVLY